MIRAAVVAQDELAEVLVFPDQAALDWFRRGFIRGAEPVGSDLCGVFTLEDLASLEEHPRLHVSRLAGRMRKALEG